MCTTTITRLVVSYPNDWYFKGPRNKRRNKRQVDKFFIAEVEQFGGIETGSEMGFGMRDLVFDFTNDDRAHQAAQYIETCYEDCGVTVDVYDNTDDEDDDGLDMEDDEDLSNDYTSVMISGARKKKK